MIKEYFSNFETIPKQKQRINQFNKKPLKRIYRTVVPKSIRRQQYMQADIIHKQYIAACWQQVISAYFKNELDCLDIKPKKNLAHQKIIWQYWAQGIDNELPEIVKLCFSSIDRHKGDYEVIRLDDKTLFDYLDIPDFVIQKRQNPQFKYAFFADLIRLALLKNYGGIWADATILVTAPIDSNFTSYDFFMFQRDMNVVDKIKWQRFNPDYFGWHHNHYVNVLNSFIISNRDNEVIKHCLNILLNFWKYADKIPHYFFFQIMFDVLIDDFLPHENCKIIDDTLPHQLLIHAHQNFDKKEYEQILSQTHIHKMTYLKKCKAGTFYEHIRKIHGEVI